jgi:hypothetical protein
MKTIGRKERIELTEKETLSILDMHGNVITNEFQVGDLVKTNKLFEQEVKGCPRLIGRIETVLFRENDGFIDILYTLDNGPEMYRNSIFDNELEPVTIEFVNEEVKRLSDDIGKLKELANVTKA